MIGRLSKTVIACWTLSLFAVLTHASPQALVIETIPKDLNLPLLGQAETADAQIAFVNRAKYSLDLTTMYWNLVAKPDAHFSQKDLDKFGAQKGAELFSALENAAARGVKIRVLAADSKLPLSELDYLKQKYSANVQVVKYNASKWFDGGIMHEKAWVADGRDLYIGSANMDWLSLAQVKELGIILSDVPELARDFTRQFDAWWMFAGTLSPRTQVVHSKELQVNRAVPCWSEFVPVSQRCDNPILGNSTFDAQYNASSPLKLVVDAQGGSFYTTNGPPEVSGKGRTWDKDAVLSTIRSATSHVDISVMDFVPASLYRDPMVYWGEFTEAIKAAVFARKVSVRVLVSKWAHTNAKMLPFWEGIQKELQACGLGTDTCKGNFDIKVMMLPGWDKTEGPDPSYPPFSRVNHTKYLVSDKGVHISTSNFSWGYFYETAGTSLDTDHSGIRSTLQAIFNRDWTSEYALPLAKAAAR